MDDELKAWLLLMVCLVDGDSGVDDLKELLSRKRPTSKHFYDYIEKEVWLVVV